MRSRLGTRPSPTRSGPTRPALIMRLRAAGPESALDAALSQLAATGRAVREGGMWRLPEHRPRLTNADEKLWERVHPLLAAGELRPPRVREIAAALSLEPEAVTRLLNRAERLGRVAKVADNRYFLPDTLARLAKIASELAEASTEGAFTAQMFKDRCRRRPQPDDPTFWNILIGWGPPAASAMPVSCSLAVKCLPDRKAGETREEYRPRWGARSSKPLGGAKASPVGSTPASSADYCKI